MGELCLLGHKIIKNLLWDILAMGVTVYLIKVYKAGKTRYTRTYKNRMVRLFTKSCLLRWIGVTNRNVQVSMNVMAVWP